jgi:hypothetical protein
VSVLAVSTKVNDGTTAGTLSLAALDGILFPTDSVALTGLVNFDSPALGDGKLVLVSGLPLDGASAAPRAASCRRSPCSSSARGCICEWRPAPTR